MCFECSEQNVLIFRTVVTTSREHFNFLLMFCYVLLWHGGDHTPSLSVWILLASRKPTRLVKTLGLRVRCFPLCHVTRFLMSPPRVNNPMWPTSIPWSFSVWETYDWILFVRCGFYLCLDHHCYPRIVMCVGTVFPSLIFLLSLQKRHQCVE